MKVRKKYFCEVLPVCRAWCVFPALAGKRWQADASVAGLVLSLAGEQSCGRARLEAAQLDRVRVRVVTLRLRRGPRQCVRSDSVLCDTQ